MEKKLEKQWTSSNNLYTSVKSIGNGGNGKVYHVKDKDGKDYALKILLNSKDKKAYNRFRDEISVLYQLKNSAAVIPLIDSFFPDFPTHGAPPFYVMPLGNPLVDFLKGKKHDELFKAFLILADGLSKLHALDITHRDIKPANMLAIQGIPVLSDFGLANFPKKERISSPNEPIGAKWTIAPEMQRISSEAEYKKADVYSLAKTLWILITGIAKSFEGQYVPESPISIKKYIDFKINTTTTFGDWHYFSVVLLEKLLIESTSNDPNERPSAAEFVKKLFYWFETNGDDQYAQRNPYEWENAIERLFPFAIPPQCQWKGAENIIKIISLLLQYDNLAYMFYPERGGDHLRSFKLGREKNEIVINDEISIFPTRLLFESVEGDKLWGYFRLESEVLQPISDTTERMEYLFDGPNGLSDEWHADANEIDRVLSGCIIFTYNSSWINNMPGELDGHSGYHSTVDADTYKRSIKLFRTAVKHSKGAD